MMHTTTPDSAIYLDYNATTPCDPRVVEKMLPFFSEWYGNSATGLHLQGRRAARVQLTKHASRLLPSLAASQVKSSSLGVPRKATISRSWGWVAPTATQCRTRIVTSAVEHKAVLLPCQKLQEEGYELIVLPVDEQGRVLLDAAEAAIDDKTLLVSVQAANNEVGTLQPIARIAEIAHEHGAIIHCDAAQAVGKIPVDLTADAWQVDLLSISAHKLYGPKGVGALYVRNGPRAHHMEPLQYGGGQEHGLRSGTTNVPGIVGFGEACRICLTELEPGRRPHRQPPRSIGAGPARRHSWAEDQCPGSPAPSQHEQPDLSRHRRRRASAELAGSDDGDRVCVFVRGFGAIACVDGHGAESG